MTYSFNLSVENEDIKKAFDVLDGERGFCNSGLFQELEHNPSVRVFRKTRDGVEGRLWLV